MVNKHRSRSQKRRRSPRRAGVPHTRPNMKTLENMFSRLSLPNPIKVVEKGERAVVGDVKKVGTTTESLLQKFANFKIGKKHRRSASRKGKGKGKGSKRRGRKSHRHRKGKGKSSKRRGRKSRTHRKGKGSKRRGRKSCKHAKKSCRHRK